MRVKEQVGTVSVTDLLVKALALSLKEFPSLNVQWKDGRIVPLPRISEGGQDPFRGRVTLPCQKFGRCEPSSLTQGGWVTNTTASGPMVACQICCW